MGEERPSGRAVVPLHPQSGTTIAPVGLACRVEVRSDLPLLSICLVSTLHPDGDSVKVGCESAPRPLP